MLPSGLSTAAPPAISTNPTVGSQQTAALVLDIDGDLVNDFVITERSQAPAVTWYRRTADGWIRHVLEAGQLSIEAGGSFADIDGDGDLDVSFGGDYGTNQVWWWGETHRPASIRLCPGRDT